MIKPKIKKNKKLVAVFCAADKSEQNRFLTLSASGELELIRSDEDVSDIINHINNREISFKDSYLFETLEDLYWQPKAANLCAHLHPPTSPEMAAFMVQRYIIPVMRDLEIIQCGIGQVLKNTSASKQPVLKAMGNYFTKRITELEKAKAGIISAGRRENATSGNSFSHYDPAIAS